MWPSDHQGAVGDARKRGLEDSTIDDAIRVRDIVRREVHAEAEHIRGSALVATQHGGWHDGFRDALNYIERDADLIAARITAALRGER